jgi:integrase
MRASAFAVPDMPTMCDALSNLDAQSHIPERKRRRWRQDSLTACKWFGLPPEKLIANSANFNSRFRGLARGTLGNRGVTAKRISNVKHSVKCVIRLLPAQNHRSFKAELSPACGQLARLVPNRYRLVSVLCILQFCSAQNIAPENFDDEASQRLLQALKDERLNGKPKITHQNAVRAWNWLQARIPGWPCTRLTPPRYAKHYMLPWAELPAWAERACNDFVFRRTTTDPFDLSRPMKTWSPQTEHTYLTHLRRYLSMLVHAGCDLRKTRSLKDIATVETAERGLRWMTEQRNAKKRGYATAADISSLLARIALNPDGKAELSRKEKNANAERSRKLSELATRLDGETGLSQTTRERLAPLKDEANLSRLFLLPFGLERNTVKSHKVRRRLALTVQWALALMILTFCPLRISTLCSITDRNLVWSRAKQRGELTLELDASQLKGNEPASIPLPPECARLMRLYLNDYRHMLVRGETQFVVPGATANRSKGPGTMSGQLRRLIWDQLGFAVNPHLYRHLVHLVILRRFPGAYVMISRVLTHKSLETAVRNYAYYDVELSMKAYQELVRDVQNGTSPQKSAPPASIAYNHSEYRHGSR